MNETVQINHSEYQKKVRTLSDESLRFICRDAAAAIRANPNGCKAGYYADEIHYCAGELNRRRVN